MKRTSTAVWLEKYSRWQIKVQKDCKRRTFTCSTPGRNGQRECNRKADEWLDENISNSSQKAGKAFLEYIENLKAFTSYSHWSQYEYYGRSWILPQIENIKIENLNEQHFQNIINTAYKKGNLSKKTLMNIRGCIMNFLKYCRKSKLTILFVEDLVIPKSAESKERAILSPDDVKKMFYDNSNSEIFVNAYRFEIVTGLRPGETLGLKWSDILGTTLTINRSINIHGEITKGKNNNAHRVISLNELLLAILNEQKQILQSYNIQSEYIFTNRDIIPASQHTYYNRWIKYCTKNGITKTSTYELRHTFVSIVKDLPTALLKNQVGHSKNMDTLGTYSHEIVEERKTTAALIQRKFQEIIQ